MASATGEQNKKNLDKMWENKTKKGVVRGIQPGSPGIDAPETNHWAAAASPWLITYGTYYYLTTT